jgi:DegV family protein with EDD domain
MAQSIQIVTDSSSDLSPQLAQEHDIAVVPLTVHFGLDVYDGSDLSLEEFWQKASGPHHPKTSQPPVGAFEDVFARSVAQGRQVLCLTLTGKHSGTFNAANLARQRFGDAVHVVDSLSLSLGLGRQALLAAQAVRKGHHMQEILALLENFQTRMRLTIILDTLENLRRGGRADSFIAVADRMTRALNIKVIINMTEGQLRLLSAARSFRSSLQRVLSLVERMGPLEHLDVVHTRNRDSAEEAAGRLAQLTGFPRERIWLLETGPVLATHGGPGLIGILAVPLPSTG